uniref:Uncharacterized protein n=1 Tax=viral metagenome TaxID=1070528 RepID=A0A6C0BVQ8_9ZZZZ
MLRNLLIVDKPTSSLKQGAAFNRKIKSYRKEGFANNSMLDQLKSEFDQTLAQYSAAYNQYVADLIKHQNSPTAKYANSLVSTLTGEKYMINKFGYLRKFASDNSCVTGTNMVLDSATIAQIPVGANLAEKEVCGLEGQMIQDSETKEVSWVDEKGVRHMKDSTVPIPEGCPTNLVGVSHDNYLAMAGGDNFTSCNTSAIKDDIHPTLVALNDKLIELSSRILRESSKLRVSSVGYEKASKNTDTIIKNQLLELKKQKDKLRRIMEQTTTLDATMTDNSAIVSASSLKYLLIAGGTAVAIGYLLFGGAKSTSVVSEHH